MGTISRLYNFLAGTPIVADQVDAELDQILGVLNGNVDAANIANATVGKPELASSALDAFLKTAAGADLAFAAGQANVTFAAANVSNVATVTHGLGRTPQFLFLTPYNGGLPFLSCMGISKTPTQFTFWARLDDGSSISSAFAVDWLAIG